MGSCSWHVFVLVQGILNHVFTDTITKCACLDVFLRACNRGFQQNC